LTAKFIVENYQGKFPETYPAIRELKGVGPYTAAAIASFAFNLPFAVVDGNVQRVISRYFGINTPTDSGSGKKFYQELAQSLLDQDAPGKYNQAIMDFGATICKPQNPLCEKCVQNKDCQAFTHGWVDILPVKEKALVRKSRWFTYYLVQLDDNIYIRQRNGKDIWSQLYEFILHETADEMQLKSSTNAETIKNLLGTSAFSLRSISPIYKQQLTHQTVFGQFVSLDIEAPISHAEFQLVRKSDLRNYAFPKLINTYLDSDLI
jgi:A/G-specific adenine glycosylase